MTTAPPTDSAARGVDLRTVAVVGLAAGGLGGLFGVGGGLLIVPGLISIVGMDRRLAHGTSLAATLPIAAASFLTFLANGHIDWPVAFALTIGALVGAVAGTQLLRVIPKRPLTIIFVITLLLTAVRLFLSPEATGRGDVSIASFAVLIVAGFASGTLAGLLGVGGGIIMVPVMVVAYGLAPVVAKGTSVAVIVPTAIMGTWRNRQNHNVNLRAAMVCGFAGTVTAIAGGIAADRISDDLSNVLFAVLLLLVAALQIATLRASDDTEET